MRIRFSAKAAPSKRGKPPEPEINVTPLVDVVLVLLIIFMVIAPNLQEGTPVVLPEVQKPDDKKLVDAIEVVVDGAGKLYLDDEETDRPILFARIGEMRAEKPDRPLVLKADAKLPYGTVRDVFVSLQRAGFSNVSLKVATHKNEES